MEKNFFIHIYLSLMGEKPIMEFKDLIFNKIYEKLVYAFIAVDLPPRLAEKTAHFEVTLIYLYTLYGMSLEEAKLIASEQRLRIRDLLYRNISKQKAIRIAEEEAHKALLEYKS